MGAGGARVEDVIGREEHGEREVVALDGVAAAADFQGEPAQARAGDEHAGGGAGGDVGLQRSEDRRVALGALGSAG